MVLTRDFPMTRREARLLVIGLVVMGAIGIALFGGLLPGIKPNFGAPSVITVDGQKYYSETTPLEFPILTNTTAPWNVSFEHVTFELWLTNWYSPQGGLVHGIGTEPNGSSYSFVLGMQHASSVPVTLYLSPDRLFGAAWSGGPFGGFLVQLLVRT